MAEKIIIRKKTHLPLVVLEMLLLAGILAYWLCKKYDLDWILGLLIFLATIFVNSFLFFRIRVFRYIFAIIFSLGWGFLGFGFAMSVTKSTVTPWLLFTVVFAVSLLLHKSYFSFESNARVVDYR